MTNNRGMTMIEIILSIALMGIIFMGILSIFAFVAAGGSISQREHEATNAVRDFLEEARQADSLNTAILNSAYAADHEEIADYGEYLSAVYHGKRLQYHVEPLDIPGDLPGVLFRTLYVRLFYDEGARSVDMFTILQ